MIMDPMAVRSFSPYYEGPRTHIKIKAEIYVFYGWKNFERISDYDYYHRGKIKNQAEKENEEF